jgi:hypothetical protein
MYMHNCDTPIATCLRGIVARQALHLLEHAFSIDRDFCLDEAEHVGPRGLHLLMGDTT